MFKKIAAGIFILMAIGAAIVGYFAYQWAYAPNISLGKKPTTFIYIPTGSSYEDVLKILTENNVLKNKESFNQLAQLKKYKNKIKPGKYKIKNNISNNELISLLRSGKQEPVPFTFTNIRKKDELLSRIGKKLEADSAELLVLLNDAEWVKKNIGMSPETVISLFIPNTYEFNWNTSAKEFLQRMESEYKKFWTAERKQKAKKLNLTPTQVSILASIVQAEQLAIPDERPTIAGLYLNRLKTGMPLQSDPTIIYAMGDFSIKRVLDKYKEYDSPYNTYQHTGLPPGPIYIPEIASIDAVLNYQKSEYLYMCAKEDFSGRHNFAKTLSQHNLNARKYQAALNKQGVFK
jgi:UPF0755 protein